MVRASGFPRTRKAAAFSPAGDSGLENSEWL
jgi:hypothetical protein